MWVKLIERDPGRPNGRLRVRILNELTNELVTLPNGRTRWFLSEEEADEWVQNARRKPPPREQFRVWR